MSGAGKAVILGVALLMIVGVGLFAATSAGYLVPPGQQDTARVLVVGTAPDESGTELAAYAFVLDTGTGIITLLDPLRPVTVSGTSARTAREALAFGGGKGVAEALAPQSGDARMPWVILPAALWSAALDEVGGVKVVVPEQFSSYQNGKLVVLEKGAQQISGAEAVVVAGAVDYFQSPDARSTLLNGIAGTVSVLAGEGDWLARMVKSGAAKSSLPAAQVPVVL